MALINCNECGKEYSDKIDACPHCGFPKECKNTDASYEEVKTVVVKKERNIKKIVVITSSIVGVIAIAAVTAYFATANLRLYNSAEKSYNAKQYEVALEKYQSLSDYKDANIKSQYCEYEIANAFLDNKQYEEALEIFNSLGNFEDSEEKSKECTYNIAENKTYALDFESALEMYKALDQYLDSAEKAKKCEYELSVDGKFMRALADGLMNRWDKNDEYEAIGEDPKIYAEFCQIELDSISEYYDAEFDDKELGKKAKQYIDLINAAKKATTYYTIDYSLYNTQWTDVYSQRTMLLIDLVNNYGLVVDDAHKDTLDDLMIDGQAASEQKEMKEKIRKITDTIKIAETADEWGYKTYKMKVTNTTEYTIEYFYIDINGLNENDDIIFTGWSTQIDNWKPGQSAEIEVWFDQSSEDFSIKGKKLEYIPHYSSGSIYE